MSGLLNKWIAIRPERIGFFNVGRMRFLLVVKETGKQVKAVELKDSGTLHTIHKNSILCIVDHEKIPEYRERARLISLKYSEKKKKLHDKYKAKMLNCMKGV